MAALFLCRGRHFLCHFGLLLGVVLRLIQTMDGLSSNSLKGKGSNLTVIC